MSDSIGIILDKTLNKLGFSKKVKEARVLDLWAEVIGDKIRKHTQAKYINKGVLFVVVDNPVWAHQLLFMKKDFISKINKLLKSNLVKDIRFQSGKITHKENFKDDYFDYTKVKLNDDELLEVEKDCGYIGDLDLKEKISKVLIKDKKLRKWKKENNWLECSLCSTLIPKDMDKCPVCQIKEEKLDKDKVRDIIYEMPWLGYEDLMNIYPIPSKSEFENIKKDLIKDIKEEIDVMAIDTLKGKKGSRNIKVLIQKYVMLETSIGPNNLNKRIIEKVIGKKYMHVYNQL
ncbi:DUF721 domain-containing protein [Halonatronum saccharophilum]|uniref:DUF721 domain-containing protein n=1 Tax=Halonatronum saccharophilum TaxID=150060 RepID=UPI00048663CC|nr:DUF721 domain-containing protein [Halonatronum saccharophilum]